MVVKAGSNGGISVRFYICTIGPQISNLKLKQFCYNFCTTSTIKIRSFTGLVTKLKLEENYTSC